MDGPRCARGNECGCKPAGTTAARRRGKRAPKRFVGYVTAKRGLNREHILAPGVC
jgi:hypothetical protein